MAEIERLTDDISLKVRFEAFVALLLTKNKIPQDKFEALLDSVPDRKGTLYRLRDMVREKYQTMDKNMGFVMKYLSAGDGDDSDSAKIAKYFDSGPAGKKEEPAAPSAEPSPEPAKPEAPAPAAVKKEEPRPVKLVFFSKPGCPDCREAGVWLDRLKEIFPELSVEEHNINSADAARLNRAHCEKFGVPVKNQLTAPSVFSAGGALVRGAVSFDSLARNVTGAIAAGDDSWANVSREDLSRSEEGIRSEYAAFSVWLIIGAGLLDGINPCAFATIIFFISYLRIARRSRAEIIRTAAAFIAGVFAAYFLAGAGFTWLVEFLSGIKILGAALNILLILICAALAAASFYDGILCSRGRLESMTLQLPEFLRTKIRESIRGSMKSRYIITAAFVSGAIVSMLELACTGQIYAPAIMFMLKSGSGTAGAMVYLLIYNAAFILPLAAAAALALAGAESQRFSGLLRKHAAAVKFSTALLFALFAALLVWRML
jgi:cytochrome c biogenesis protein CcdA/glutaredoxin